LYVETDIYRLLNFSNLRKMDDCWTR